MADVKRNVVNGVNTILMHGKNYVGKTYTALLLATALADGKGVALIDTEHKSASKYADIFEFDTSELETFHPQKYIDAIHEAESAGYAVLVIDSLSHAWSGQGGLLEEKDKIARQKYGGNSFSAWNDASALQNKLVNVILGAKLHIIATVRSKMDYVLEQNDKGKQTPRKVGMAPVQRDDLPYEFDVFCSMEVDNTLIVDKSRCPALSGAVIAKPDAAVAEILKEWLSGEPVPELPQAEANKAPAWLAIYEQGKRGGNWKDVPEFYHAVGILFEREDVNKSFLDGLDAIQLGWLKRETVEKKQGSAA